jgi:hypothetical protein
MILYTGLRNAFYHKAFKFAELNKLGRLKLLTSFGGKLKSCGLASAATEIEMKSL